MKQKLLTLIIALVVSAGTYAQNIITTMTTTASEVNISVKWNGSGEIFANGTLLLNNYDNNTIISDNEGKVVLTATEDAELTTLGCSYNQLTELDVSNNTALAELYCYVNQLTELDVRNNLALTYLDCEDNLLTELDIRNNTALTVLYCRGISLTELDVRNNTALKRLYCNNNQLTELDVRNNTELTWLDCFNNQLTELDVRNNTALTGLRCYNNPLTELDVKNNTALTELRCDNNQLTELDISNNTELTWLSCPDNQLTNLDVSKHPALINLFCGSNQLTELDISNNTALAVLDCSYNQLSNLNLSGFNAAGYASFQQIIVPVVSGATSFSNPIYYHSPTEVEKVEINGVAYAQGEEIPIPEGITELAFTSTVINGYTYSGTIILANLIATMTSTASKVNIYVWWNGTGKIFVNGTLLGNSSSSDYSIINTITPDNKGKVILTATEDAELVFLECDNNQLTELDVRNNTALTGLQCRNNQLTELDIRNNTALVILGCDNNLLTELDVRNNTELAWLSCPDNQLTELDIRNNTELIWLYCNNNQLTELYIRNNTALTELVCSDNQLTELDVRNNMALTKLVCGGNQLTRLDVNNNTALTDLICSVNQLTELDLRNNTALTYLSCFDNQLTELDIRNNTELRVLGCDNNQLTVLDLSNNTALTWLDCFYNQLSNLNLSGCNALENVSADPQRISVSVASGATSFSNPIYYHNPTEVEKVMINGVAYAQGEEVPIPAGTIELMFTSTAIGYSNFSGTISIVNNNVVAEEPEPTGNDGKGSFDLSFEISGDVGITGSFNIQLPEGYTLDEASTFLSETLAELFQLVITLAGDNTWRIEIVSNGLRASHDIPEYTRIMSIGYIVDESVLNGSYQIELTDIDMQLEDGTPIQQESIIVTTEVQRSETGISPTAVNPVRVYSTNEGIVIENAPIGETIRIYNVSGALVETQYFASLPQTTIAIPQGIYIVKVGGANFKVISGK